MNRHSLRYYRIPGAMLSMFIFAILLMSAGQQTKDFNKTLWLEGTWMQQTPRGAVYETWKRASNNELSAINYTINDRDTLLLETIKLVENEDGLFYIPTVLSQNEGLPITFRLKTIDDNHMVFENPDHDFPQQIAYSRITPDSLVAEISGYRNGQFRAISFPKVRVKD